MLSEASGIDEGTFTTEKHHTEEGSWTATRSQLLEILEASDTTVTKYSGLSLLDYHVAEIVTNPTDTQKLYSSTHDTTNSNKTSDSSYTGEELDWEQVNQIYIFLERNWYDIKFVANDNGQQNTSTKATISVN